MSSVAAPTPTIGVLERRVAALLDELDAGRRPAPDDVAAVSRDIAAIPRGTTTVPTWKRAELEAARQELEWALLRTTPDERAPRPRVAEEPAPQLRSPSSLFSPTPASLEAHQMRARARRFTAGVARGLPIPRRAIAELLLQFDERRSALATGDRVLNDAAVRELSAAVLGMGQAAPE